MAKIQYGALVDDIVGSIGGWTFQRNRGGSIVRNRGRTFKNPSTKQSISRQSLTKYLQLWQALSFSNKELWNDYADTWEKDNIYGQTKTLSGQNWFQSVNFNKELMGLALVDSPRTHILPDAVEEYEIELTDSSINLIWDPPWTPSGNVIIIRSTTPISNVTQSFRQSTRIIAVNSSHPYSTLDITAKWEDVLGISYPPSSSHYCFSIGVVIQTLVEESAISSAGLFKTQNIKKLGLGIGYMQIGTSFVIS